MNIRSIVAFTILALPVRGMCQTSSALAADSGATEDAPIIVDEEPEAFFIEAPPTLAKKMRGALKAACVSSSGTLIFCDGTPLRFLREVGVYGNRKSFGFACTKDSLFSRNKYFTPESIRGKSSCIWINCSSGDSCEVDPDGLRTAKDNA
jgi:hypothetical protein